MTARVVATSIAGTVGYRINMPVTPSICLATRNMIGVFISVAVGHAIGEAVGITVGQAIRVAIGQTTGHIIAVPVGYRVTVRQVIDTIYIAVAYTVGGV